MKGLSKGIELALVTALLVVVNLLAAYLPGRVDLTEDGRYTLTRSTEALLESIEDPVFIEVLLGGNYPAGFQRLSNSTEEMLRDFAAINGLVEYEFSDPGAGSVDDINAARTSLSSRGLSPINFSVQDAGERSERLLWPYAIVTYRGQTASVNLLENNVPGQSPDVAVNNSVSLLEYKLANAIQKLRRAKKPFVAYVEGHGELTELQTRDLSNALSPFYAIGRVRLDSLYSVGPEDIGALIVAEPKRPYSEREKFVLDQYVMRGGRLLVLLDKLAVNLDSLRRAPEFIPNDQAQNLDDLLFEYGVRIEPNLVLDLQSTRVPIVVGQVGNAPQFELRTWPYHVLANPSPGHPITRSLQPVQLYFPSEIDTTIRTQLDVRKTVLLSSTGNALLRFSPARISLEDARYDLERARFNKGPVALAVLLEGRFTSLYENRVGSEFLAGLEATGQPFRASSEPSRIVVVADGDIAKNPADPANNAFRPLGYNEFEKYVFDNRDFLINALEYLFDDSGVITARTREVRLRLLDAPRAREEATFWRVLNVGLPLVLLAGFAVVYRYLRRRRYAY